MLLPFRLEGRKLPINIKASKMQADTIERNLDHIEVWPEDAHRVRIVYKDGRKGQWFSRLWNNIKYGDVAPK